jgi:pyruvate kinase
MSRPNLQVTLWPSFPHFPKFAADSRLSGIRLNSAMMHVSELDVELEKANAIKDSVPLWFDIKGRQMRVVEVLPNKENLELILNHPIECPTPQIVLFKAGADFALLKEIKDGNRLMFDGGPHWNVYAGESIHIRNPLLKVGGPIFIDSEIEKIKRVVAAGFERFYLSYVEDQRDIDEFREHVGDRQVIAKIESPKGLEYVFSQFKKQDNLSLMAARGDLFVEVDKPHHILEAMKLIISKDKDAFVGSRLLLSLVKSPVPECSDLSDLAWLYDLGYRNYLLCDELCLKDELMSRAVNVFHSFRYSYALDFVSTSSSLVD